MGFLLVEVGQVRDSEKRQRHSSGGDRARERSRDEKEREASMEEVAGRWAAGRDVGGRLGRGC